MAMEDFIQRAHPNESKLSVIPAKAGTPESSNELTVALKKSYAPLTN